MTCKPMEKRVKRMDEILTFVFGRKEGSRKDKDYYVIKLL